jgi:hypothetical protein
LHVPAKFVVGSPTIARGNQELRELALQISRQVLPNGSPQSPDWEGTTPSPKARKWRQLAFTVIGATVVGFLLALAVALWIGPSLVRATGAHRALPALPAVPASAQSAAPIRPVRELAPAQATGRADAFGELRVKQPQWSVSAAATASATAQGNSPAARDSGEGGNSPPPANGSAVGSSSATGPEPLQLPAKPSAPIDATASIAPQKAPQNSDAGSAAAPAAATHARSLADPRHRLRRSKRSAPPTDIAPEAAADPPEPADRPVAPTMPDVAGRTGSRR